MENASRKFVLKWRPFVSQCGKAIIANRRPISMRRLDSVAFFSAYVNGLKDARFYLKEQIIYPFAKYRRFRLKNEQKWGGAGSRVNLSDFFLRRARLTIAPADEASGLLVFANLISIFNNRSNDYSRLPVSSSRFKLNVTGV